MKAMRRMGDSIKIIGDMKILVLFLVLSLSCSQKTSNKEVYGDWRAVHIFYEGEEILKNNYKETGWFPSYNKAKRFYIHKGSMNLYLDRHEKPIVGEFTFVEQDSTKINIYNATDVRFNGIYQYKLEKDTVMQEGVKTAYYFLTLESEDTKIMAVRNKAIFEKQRN